MLAIGAIGRQVQMCDICNFRMVNGYNYGAYSCKACKMFFRRTIFDKNLEDCRREGNCTQKCRNCRFKKCIRAGMTYTPSENLMDARNLNALSAFIFNLSHQESHRQFQLNNCIFQGDPTVGEIVQEVGPIRMFTKPENYPMNFGEWIFITGITSLDYLKKFIHVNVLNESDREYLLKYTFFEFSLFTDAMRAQKRRQDFISFPDGSEVIRVESEVVSQNLVNRIRCRLAGRVNELKVTEEEFLLLSMVLFCNPAIRNISESGRGILNTYQKTYSSALLQYCLLTYDSKNGPARFMDLLSIYHIIKQTRTDIGQLYILNTIKNPGPPLKQIYIFR